MFLINLNNNITIQIISIAKYKNFQNTIYGTVELIMVPYIW